MILDPDDAITRFSAELGKFIREMNNNIEVIKIYMSVQNTINEVNLESISELEKRIKELEDVRV